MTASLSELEKLAANDTVRFDLTSSSSSSSLWSGRDGEDNDDNDNNNDNDNHETSLSSSVAQGLGSGLGSGVQRMPSRLKQEYLFMPAQVHTPVKIPVKNSKSKIPNQIMPAQFNPQSKSQSTNVRTDNSRITTY